jgi:hypothetical protein
MKTPMVGKNVDSWCTRCKLVLAHTIEAVMNGKITRVHCNTCGGQHAHRAKAPGEGGAARARKSASAEARASMAARDYKALLAGRSLADARTYSTAERFKVGELISHPAFGLGAVMAERDRIKIEVLFPDGPRVLIHGRVG